MARGRIRRAAFVSGTVRLVTFFAPTRGSANYRVVLYRGRPRPLEQPCAILDYAMPLGEVYSKGDLLSHLAVAGAGLREAVLRGDLYSFDADWEGGDEPRLVPLVPAEPRLRPAALAAFAPRVIRGGRATAFDEADFPADPAELLSFAEGFYAARRAERVPAGFYEAGESWRRGFQLGHRLTRERDSASIARVESILALGTRPRRAGHPGAGHGRPFFTQGRRTSAARIYDLYATTGEAFYTDYGISADGMTLYSYRQPIALKEVSMLGQLVVYLDPRYFSAVTARRKVQAFHALTRAGWRIERRVLGSPR